MKRLAKPGEGEVPVGASEVPGGGPQAYTDHETGERMIDDYEVIELGFIVTREMVDSAPVETPKPSRKRK